MNLYLYICIYCTVYLTYSQNFSKDRCVIDRGAIPLVSPELILTLCNALVCAPAHVHHVVSVEHAQLLLAHRQAVDGLAQGHGRAQQQGFVRERIRALKAKAPEMRKLRNSSSC